MSIEQPAPDYSKARQWLRDEGYSSEELATPEQLRAAVASLKAEARRRAELARDVADEIQRAEAEARLRGSVRGVLAMVDARGTITN